MSAYSSSDPDPILAQLDWVRALCLRLVRDAAAADDLVQEVWLVAQAKLPGAALGPHATRGWLGKVAQNLARNNGRSEAHRRDRERTSAASVATKSAAAPASDELVARSELLGLVAQGVRELDEPFRRAMLLRWFEGHSPTEIARMEGVPVGTVQSRLNRGRERLRAWMTEHYPCAAGDSTAGTEANWALALVPVASRALVLNSTGAWLGAKGIVLGGLAIAALVATGMLLPGWIERTDGPVQPDLEEALIPLPLGPSEPSERAVNEPDEGDRLASLRVEAPTAALAPIAAPSPKDLTVRVTDYAGNPAPGLKLQIQSVPDEFSRVYANLPWKTDEEGVAVIPNERLERFDLGTGIVFASIVALDLPTISFDPEHRDVELILPPTGSVIASFEDASGTPILATGSARLMVPQSDRNSRNFLGATIKDGEVLFPYVEPGLERMNLDPGPSWMGVTFLNGPHRAGETVRVLCPTPANETVLTARLVDHLGQPIPDLNVNLESPPGSQSEFLSADSRGTITFALERHEVSAPHKLRLITKTDGPLGHAYADLTVDVSTGEARRHLGDIALTVPETCFAGVVTDVSGHSLERADVSITARVIGGRSILGGMSATTNADGEFALPKFEFSPGQEREDGTYWLELSVNKIGYVAEAIAVPGKPDLDISMAMMPTIRVSIEVEAPPHWALLTLRAKRVDEPEASSAFFQRGRGDTSEAQLGPGTWQLAVYRGGYGGLPLLTLPPFELSPGDSAKTLEPVQLEGSYREKPLRFEDESGNELPRVELILDDVTTAARGSVIFEAGSTLTLPIGPVRIRARGRTADGTRLEEVTWTSTGSGSEVITLPERQR